MSRFVSEPLHSDEKVTVGFAEYADNQYAEGQRHNRIPGDAANSMTTAVEGDSAPEKDISAGQKMLSAVSGSLLTSLLVTPLDVVRVRLQSQPASSNIRTAATSSTPFSNLPPNLGVTACCREVFWVNNNAQYCVATTPTTPSPLSALSNSSHITSLSATDCAIDETRRRTFTSTFDGLRKIARYEGLSTLWRGLSPTLVMAIPANVIYFTGYDTLRTSHSSPLHTLHIPDAYAPLLAGSLARIAAASVISPVEMFRTRMQATSGTASPFRATLTGLTSMVQSQGYTSLWRGLTLTMWRDVPFSGIYWWGYEAARNALTDMRDQGRGKVLDPQRSRTRLRSSSRGRENHTATFVDSFAAGAVSGGVAAVVTTPFDVGKTRQQVLKHAGDNNGATRVGGLKGLVTGAAKEVRRPEDRSMPRFLWHIWTTEGVQGLFRGWAARCLKVAPACAIMISSYEVGKKMARGVNERKEERG